MSTESPIGKLQKVRAVKDDAMHWHVIPLDNVDEFYKDLEDEHMVDSGQFDDKWGKYRTGGDLNIVQLWAEL